MKKNSKDERLSGITVAASLILLLGVWKILNSSIYEIIIILQYFFPQFILLLLIVSSVGGAIGLLKEKRWGWRLSVFFLLYSIMGEIFLQLKSLTEGRGVDDILIHIIGAFFILLMIALLIYLLRKKTLKKLKLDNLKIIREVLILGGSSALLIFISFLILQL